MDVRHFVDFAELIKAIRRHHNLSQRALAKALRVSPGYIGQWELRLSQPSAEVAIKLCRVFSITDIEYVQRLAYAQRAPAWLRESIIRYRKLDEDAECLSSIELRLVRAARKLSDEQAVRLAERVEDWVKRVLAEDDGKG
jgi:transcriptional regulator with XRE-family HTH domain